MVPYVLMLVATFLAIGGALFLRMQAAAPKTGFICWLSLFLYFPIESVVIRHTAAPYDALRQPMSDLGVTTCGSGTYPLAPYVICSPSHLLMNWTFTLTGVAIAVGAILLHEFWPPGRRARTATALLVVYGLSYSISGIVPADLGFIWHTLGSLPGMVVQIPALLLIGLTVRGKMLSIMILTLVCLTITSVMLLLLLIQPVFPTLPGGLLQRLLYGSVYIWMGLTTILLRKNNSPAVGHYGATT